MVIYDSGIGDTQILEFLCLLVRCLCRKGQVRYFTCRGGCRAFYERFPKRRHSKKLQVEVMNERDVLVFFNWLLNSNKQHGKQISSSSFDNWHMLQIIDIVRNE